jgi:hypothetical protein
MRQSLPPQETLPPHLSLFPFVAFPCVLALAEAAATAHSIAEGRHDVILHSRPDLRFSHAINFRPLIESARKFGEQKRDFVLLQRHSGTRPGEGHDPSELLVIGARGFWKKTFDGTAVRRSSRPWDFDFEAPEGILAFSTTKHYIGCQARIWAYVLCMHRLLHGLSVYFMSGVLKLHLLRVSGDYGTYVNRDKFHTKHFKKLVTPTTPISSRWVVDVTADLVCAYGRSFLKSQVLGSAVVFRNSTKDQTPLARCTDDQTDSRPKTKRTPDAPMAAFSKKSASWSPGITTHDFMYVCTQNSRLEGLPHNVRPVPLGN